MKSDSKEEKENPDLKQNRGLACPGASFQNYGKEKETACKLRERGNWCEFCGLIGKECICCPVDRFRCGKLPFPPDP